MYKYLISYIIFGLHHEHETVIKKRFYKITEESIKSLKEELEKETGMEILITGFSLFEKE